MESVQIKCESCKIKPVDIHEQPHENHQSYLLCNQCHQRLVNKALRPLEFFNLAAIHGHNFYLQDDFYDFDTGEATQPNISVADKEKYPFPDLNEIKNDISKLIDYACVQYFTSDNVVLLLKNFDKKDVLQYLQFKVNYNRAINYKTFEIAARVLNSFAADWIKKEWGNRKENELLLFAEAIAKCLPFDEAFETITNAIDNSTERKLTEDISALLFFKNNKILEWIEKQIEYIKNVSTSWGTLAAASQFDWATAKKWLDYGRPLSLIALDALIYCTTTGDRYGQALWLQQNQPKLFDSEKLEIIANELTWYLEKDNVPRTKTAVRQIINNLFEIAV